MTPRERAALAFAEQYVMDPSAKGGLSFVDHQPELFGAFNRLYGTLWSEGLVDQPRKSLGCATLV